jgi:outer membrane protein assembly complex protein YaeT
MQGKMRANASLAISLFGLLVARPAFATPQEIVAGAASAAGSSPAFPAAAIIGEIKFVGLHRVPLGALLARLSSRSGETYNPAKIDADLHSLTQFGWFEDVSVQAQESEGRSETSPEAPARCDLEFHMTEYPLLTGVEYTGSKILSQREIEKLLKDNALSPSVGALANPVKLRSVALALQEELRCRGHARAQVSMAQHKLPGQRVKVAFQIQDGPRLPVLAVGFSGDAQLSDALLRKQMREIAPDAWFSGLRNKNVFTLEKAEQDRVNLRSYFQNHGFPQAQVGEPQVLLDSFSDRPWPWFRLRTQTGLSIGLPIRAGNLYTFGPLDVNSALRERLGRERKRESLLSDVVPGRPYSQHAVDSVQRSWELRLRRKNQGHKRRGDYRLKATPTFDSSTHLASVKFDFDPTPPYIVRHIDFRGNQRFPDRFLRRRIGLEEAQPLDEYALEAGLARIAQTGYFQPFKKQDVRIETHDPERTADVTIHVHEKGRQRTTFSGGREQFGSTLGIAYTVYNLLGMDEFLATQIDGGPQTLQLAASLAMEGFLGSRATLALSVFDMFLRPRFTGGVQAPFERTRTAGTNVAWSYAASEVDTIGINYGISRSLVAYGANPPAGSGTTQATDLRSATSSHALGVGWTHDSGEQRIQFADSVSGGLLGGSENLLKSQAAYGRILPDEVIDSHNAWAFRTTIRAAGSYKGDMPLYAHFFSSDDLLRGLRPGELGPYQMASTVSGSGATTYSAAPAGANLVAASNLEYRVPLGHGVEGASFFDAGSGWLLPNWLGPSRPPLIPSTNGILHGATGFELRWTVPALGVPLRVSYSFNVLRLNRSFLMPDGSLFRLHNRAGALGWGIGPFF